MWGRESGQAIHDVKKRTGYIAYNRIIINIPCRLFALICNGKAIKYSGATDLDAGEANGDVRGTASVFALKGDTCSVDRSLSLDDMNALFKKIDG